MPPHPANFCIIVETGFCHVGQAGLELLISGDPSASASQSAGITGVSYYALPMVCYLFDFLMASVCYYFLGDFASMFIRDNGMQLSIFVGSLSVFFF